MAKSETTPTITNKSDFTLPALEYNNNNKNVHIAT